MSWRMGLSRSTYSELKKIARAVFTKKFIFLIILGYYIPQAIYLLINLLWTVFIVLLFFLLCELGLVLILQNLLPGSVNVGQVLEWTLTSIFRVGGSLGSVLCQIAYSCLDLAFGKVFQSRGGALTSGDNERRRSRRASGNNGNSNSSSSPRPNIQTGSNGHTPLARRAMSNSAGYRGRPARFSL